MVLALVGGAIVVLMLGGVAIMLLRKKVLEKDTAGASAAGLMEQLREMHRRGEISDAEYEQTRRTMASRVSTMLDTKRSGGLFEQPEPKRRPPRPPSKGDPVAPASPSPAQSELRAPPGYDLTGAPLPGSRPGSGPVHPERGN